MREAYYSLKFGENKNQLGRIIRTRGKDLEEMTSANSFEPVKPITELQPIGSENRYIVYMMDANNITGTYTHPNDYFKLGVLINNTEKRYAREIEIASEPKKGKVILEQIDMQEAGSLLVHSYGFKNK